MAILDIINKNISKLSTPILTPEEREAPFGDLVSRVKNNITKLGGAQQTPLTMTPEEVSKRITGGIDRLKGTKTIFKTAQEIGQEITKSGGSVGLTLTGKDKLEIDSSSSQWQQKIQETIFGKEPVKSLQTRIAEGELKIQPFLRKRGLEKAALPISFLGVGLITGIDFTGLGGSKNAIKLLSKSKDIPFITKTLKQIGVADDIILPAAQKIATITDEKEIKLAIDKISELQKTTKVAPGIKSTTQATKTEPLAQEARKYKSAEEFVRAPEFEYHISKTPNLLEGKTFAEQTTKRTGQLRGFSGGAEGEIFTTKAPQFWHSQLAKEGQLLNNVYLVKVKKPSPGGLLESGFDAQASNIAKDVRVVKKLGTADDVFDAGKFESIKNK